MARLLTVAVVLLAGVKGLMATDPEGPSFTVEPPSFADFSNNTGIRLPCAAQGSPSAEVSWMYMDGTRITSVVRLRHVHPNGTLVLLPFRAEDYRQDVHATIYKCRASNQVGVIVSRPVRLRAGKNLRRFIHVWLCDAKLRFVYIFFPPHFTSFKIANLLLLLMEN
uniref:Ig-like domain-containing protein n=1 Tax=Strigamia maritima TaxID=126957 RepID=T1JL89_STRMM